MESVDLYLYLYRCKVCKEMLVETRTTYASRLVETSKLGRAMSNCGLIGHVYYVIVVSEKKQKAIKPWESSVFSVANDCYLAQI